jgi:hypothetical protein
MYIYAQSSDAIIYRYDILIPLLIFKYELYKSQWTH